MPGGPDSGAASAHLPDGLTADERRQADAAVAAVGGGAAERRVAVRLAGHDGPADDRIGQPGWWVVEAGLDAGWLGQMAARAGPAAGDCGVFVTSASMLAGMVIEPFAAALTAAGWLAPGRRDDVVLVLTELVANAVIHGNLTDLPPDRAPPDLLARGVGLHAAATIGEVAITVLQQGPGPGRRLVGASTVPDPHDLHGRGLFIVAALADRVAVDDDGAACTVAFRRAAG